MSRRILTEMMSGYFGQSQDSDPLDTVLGRISLPQPNRLPVSPKVSSGKWTVEQAPRRLTCTYKFEDPRHISEFMSEILAHEAETGHNARITCEFPHVKIEVRTHDLDDVTELDQQYAEMCNHAYDDIKYYGTAPVGSEDGYGW